MGLTTTPQPFFYNVKKTEILVEKAYLTYLHDLPTYLPTYPLKDIFYNSDIK